MQAESKKSHINARVINGVQCHRRRDGWSVVAPDGTTVYRCQFLKDLKAYCANPPPEALGIAKPAQKAPAPKPTKPNGKRQPRKVKEAAPAQPVPEAQPIQPAPAAPEAPKGKPGNPTLGRRYMVGPKGDQVTPFSQKKPAFFRAIELAKALGVPHYVTDTMAGREAVVCGWCAEANGALKETEVWRDGKPQAIPMKDQKILRFRRARKIAPVSDSQMALGLALQSAGGANV